MNTTTYFVLNCNVLALLSFYALPSGGKLKDAVVYCPKTLHVIAIPTFFFQIDRMVTAPTRNEYYKTFSSKVMDRYIRAIFS